MKSKIILLLLYPLLILGNSILAQNISSEELLNKSITYHDPNGVWSKLQGKLEITMTYPDGGKRFSKIEIDMPREYFRLTSKKEGITTEQTIAKGECSIKLNGRTYISEEDRKAHRLTCERAMTMKNYYLYLYGLPMKLKDSGTRINPKVKTKSLKGKDYLVLKVTYDESVGEDTWYFYFDPKTYAMEVYQFFHDESKKDGEYVLLEGLESVNGMKIPKKRSWFTNKEKQLLGTDLLTSYKALN
ncbi:DUF6503 family protein [Muriicola sp.]|uniref:DUF6503 family protein n=1 Tax=Muriicola sp. TaxID=2020856 RepID=UPI003C781053